MLYALFRFLMILLGLVAAALAAGATLMLVETSGLMRPFNVSVEEARDSMFVNALILSAYALMLGFVPAFLFGLAAEIFRLRSIAWFALAGAAIGIYVVFQPLPSWINYIQEGEPLIRNAEKAFPAAGIVAGAMYWLITGVKAGFTRDKLPPAPARQ